MRKLYKNNYGIASPIEFSIASMALISTLVVVTASMAPPVEQASAQFYADANAKATEIMSLLLTSDSQAGLVIDPETSVPIPPTGSISDITILNSCPTVQEDSEIPIDGATDVPLNPPNNCVELSVYVYDVDEDDVMNVSFYDFTSGELIGEDFDVSNPGTAYATWSKLSEEVTYRWYVTVNDSKCNQTYPTSGTWQFTTKKNNPPDPPARPRPVMPFTYITDVTYYFVTSTTDPDGDQVLYNWSWGDGSSSGWIGPYESETICEASHAWSNLGPYNIEVQAKDYPYGHLSKDPSPPPPLKIVVSNNPYKPNTPPNEPTLIDWPQNNPYRAMELLGFACSVVDPDDILGNVYHCWDWDSDLIIDDIEGPYMSDQPVITYHAWLSPGEYLVRVRGWDGIELGPWCSTVPLIIIEEGVVVCFLAGTQILMADGSQKNIEDIQIGDMVTSYDEKTDTLQNDRVTEIYHDTPAQMISDYYLIVNNHLKVTPDHLLYINNEWIQAGDLKLGDHLFKGKVTSLEKIYEKVPSYNIEIEKYHTYLVVFGDNIVIAHNARRTYTHALYGNEEEISLSRQTSVTENDYTALLSMDKIYELSEIPYQDLKEILGLPDGYYFYITIGNSESIFLNYMPNEQISLDSANVVVTCSENVIIVDSVGYAYATIAVTVVR